MLSRLNYCLNHDIYLYKDSIVVPQPVNNNPEPSKTIIFSSDAASSSSESTQADDNIEDDEDPVQVNDDDVNKIVLAALPGQQPPPPQQPVKFTSFTKKSPNARAIETPQYAEQFTLAAWLRRPGTADRNTKEHVLCGTDSKTMNRHHFGLYFYKGNLKFLLRREPKTAAAAASKDDVFYPSLWEWQLSDAVLTDAKWHLYEVRFTYPNASLFIDGVKFVETQTNSDIIDAYELNNVADVGTITTYVGACYHGMMLFKVEE